MMYLPLPHLKMTSAAVVAALVLTGLSVNAVDVVVPGTADPWLAGMPDGTTSNVGTPEPADVAPTHSPVQVTGLPLLPGTTLTWSASGQVHHGPGFFRDPDGEPSVSLRTHNVGAEHGISDVNAPITALLGVFLGSDQPDLSPAPVALDFSTAASRDYSTLGPALKQVFFMGDGLTSGSATQQIVVPADATRLYLGVMDGYGWANNAGSFKVSLRATGVPDGGGSLALLGAATLALALMRRRGGSS